MAEQEEPKNAAPGQTPSPVKPHVSGLAGTTQHLSHPVDTADRTATVPIAKVSVGGKPMPKPSPSAVPSAAPADETGARSGSNDTTMRLRKNPAPTIKLTPQVPAGASSPSAAPTIKLTPQASAGAPSPSAQTIKLMPTGGAAASAPTIKLTPQAPAGAPSPSAQTIKLTSQAPAGAPSPSAQTIKLMPQASAQTVSPVKMVPPAANVASQAVKPSGADDTENAHTVRIARPPHTGQGLAPMPEPAASVKPPSAVPGAKQTIKLRPSSTGSVVSAMSSPAGGPVKLGATPASKTIKLAPLGNGGAKVVPQTPAAQQQAAPGSAPRVNPPQSSAGSDAKKPIGGKTMKLSLHKPAGTPAAGTAGAPKAPALTLPGAAGKEKAAASEVAEEEKPNIVFFLISIAAMLVVVFTVLLMTVQFANMYHGANVNIPGMTRLTGGPR